MENQVLNEVAREKGVDVAQICISWGLQRGIGVLPKSGDKERIARNFKVVQLSESQMDKVGRVATGRGGAKRFVDLRETFGFDVFNDEDEGESEN